MSNEAKVTETTSAAAVEAANGEGKPNGKDRKPRDETPIEELYNLKEKIPPVSFIFLSLSCV
jgi:hypothetical protein